MREALNSNRTVQIVVCGILLVVVGLFFATSVLKKSDSSSGGTDTVATSTAPASGATSSTGAATGTAAAAAGAAAAIANGEAASSGAAGSTDSASGAIPVVPGPPLPANVQSAYDSGKAVVLLVVRKGGIDDAMVRNSVSALGSNGELAVFIVPSPQIAHYARITQGVSVDRTPALVVVKPKPLSNGVPLAEVHYGFRSAQSVAQAVRDALYTGPTDVPYHP
jgi:hypothetical protein